MIIPNYYNKFSCIAGRCRHSCCIGWEIDIDDDTYEYYKSIEGSFGDCIRNSISLDGCAHFILGTDERCPHLNEKGLCNIITNLGEDALCNICYEHPRFYNSHDNFTECGIGLCCEEAARIIMSMTTPFTLICEDIDELSDITEDEQSFINERSEIISTISDRKQSMAKRFYTLCNLYSIDFSFFTKERLIPLFLSLERLDENWTEILDSIKNSTFNEDALNDNKLSIYFENLACYFIFRHFKENFYLGTYKESVMFCIASCYLAGMYFSMMKSQSKLTFECICDFARMLSSETEYSEDNMELLTKYFIENS